MREICARHGLRAEELAPASSGTNVVFTTVDHVVKLCPPIWNDAAIGEQAVLQHLEGRFTLETPKLVAAGRFEDWRYLVVARLAGTSLAEIWNTLDASARQALAEVRVLGER